MDIYVQSYYLFIHLFNLSKLHTRYEAQTQDREFKSHMLCRLSQPGAPPVLLLKLILQLNNNRYFAHVWM